MNRKAVLLVLAFLGMVNWRSAHAQGNEPPIPNPPSEGTYVLDTLDWLTTAQEDEANQIIQKLDRDGIAELFVITLDDCGSDKRSYRKSVLHTWSVGQPNANNGLLILVCWYGGDTSLRSVEQEFGPGLNGFLSGDITDRVAKEQFVPSFKNNHPGDGLLGMVVYYDAMLRNPPESQPSLQSSESTSNTFDPMNIALIGIVVVVFLIAYFKDIKNGSTGSNYYGSEYHDSGGDSGGGGGGDSGSSTSF